MKQPFRAFSAFLLSAGAAIAADVTLAPGRTEVVIAPGAPQTVRYAADEMTNWLARAFGTPVPIVTKLAAGDGGDAAPTSIVLGENAWSKAAGIDPSKEPRDTFFVEAGGNRVYIVGRDDANFPLLAYLKRGGSFACTLELERGTIHGVYAFLEKYAGIRFYWPDDELGVVVPRAAKIAVPAGRTKTTPEFLIREPYFNGDGAWYCAADPAIDNCRVKAREWMRLRLSSMRIPCAHGIESKKFDLRARFGKTHPEFFPVKGDNVHLCWTNPELREIIYRDVKKRLLAGEKVVDIMPDDGFEPCPCARCQAAYEREKGSNDYAGSLIWGFAAEVGNRLVAEGVKGDVTMMSYDPYQAVPDFPLPPNVKVMVAVYGPWSLPQRDYTQSQYDRIRAWQRKTGGKVWIWTYPYKHGQLAFEGIPQMAPHAWAKYYLGIRDAIFGSFAETESDRPFYNYLNYYVFSRLMWDSSVDVEAILAEHDRLLYGPAAADMRAFNDLLEKTWTERVAGSCFMDKLGPVPTPPCALELWTSIYNRAFLDRLLARLNAAKAKVRPDSLEARRIALVKREFYAPLEKVSDDFRRETDIAAERAYRAAHPENVNIMAGAKICKEVPLSQSECFVSTGQLVRASTSMLTQGLRRLKPNTRYRISYFLKLEDVKPISAGGGFACVIWDARNNLFPGRGKGGNLTGTTDWIAQHFEITTDPETNVKTPAYYRLDLWRMTGRVRLNALRFDELPKERPNEAESKEPRRHSRIRSGKVK